MKRLVLLLTMVCGLASLTHAAHAGTARPKLPSIAQFLPSARQVVPQTVAHEAAHSGAISSAQQLRLTPNYMGVGSGWTMTMDQQMSPADADVNTIQGSLLHYYTPLANLGVLGLYYEESVASVANSSSYYWLTYLAGYYADASSATAAFDDAATTFPTRQGFSPQTCTVPAGVPSPSQCVSLTWTPQAPDGPFTDHAGNIYRVTIRVLQILNAVFEYGYLLEISPVDLFDANKSTGESNLDVQTSGIAMLFSSQQAPTATPTIPPVASPTATPPPVSPTATATPTQIPISFEILARWEKPSNKPDPNKKLSKAKKGTKVDAIAFVNVDSAPASEPVDVGVVIKRGSKTYLDKSGQFPLDSSDPSGLYYAGYRWKVPKQTGTYKLTTLVTIGGKQATSSASLKVT